MTTKADFTDEEWTRLKRAPFVAGMGVSLADPGGPIEAGKETLATLRAALPSTDGASRGELVDALSARPQVRRRGAPQPAVGLQAGERRAPPASRSSTSSRPPTRS